MNKKTFITLICLLAVLFVVGIVLWANTDTPYHVNKSIIENVESGKADKFDTENYSWALGRVRSLQPLYYTGLILIYLPIPTAIIILIGHYLKKKEQPIAKDISSYLD